MKKLLITLILIISLSSCGEEEMNVTDLQGSEQISEISINQLIDQAVPNLELNSDGNIHMFDQESNGYLPCQVIREFRGEFDNIIVNVIDGHLSWTFQLNIEKNVLTLQTTNDPNVEEYYGK